MISPALALKLQGLTQVVLSNMEMGRLLEAKLTVLQLSAHIACNTDHGDEVERFKYYWPSES